MLKLRRGVVRSADPLEVEIDGELRAAWADEGLVGRCEVGDEVVCNVTARDLGLGSGGFDLVHVNLTRGLEGGDPPEGVHVLKLNYSSLQHAVDPVELGVDSPPRPSRSIPVAVISLHGQLPPLAWAAGQGAGGRPRVGFLQGTGGALPGSLSRAVAMLLEEGLLCDHLTAGPAHGAAEAISLIGALHAAAEERGWDAAIVGPGPGILGSATRYGHGGMAALDGCHAAAALGLGSLLVPRLSSGDERPRHLGLSHHSAAVLELALTPQEVAMPEAAEPLWPERDARGAAGAQAWIESLGHRISLARADLDGYAGSGLPRGTMGRDLQEDALFFASPLAAGELLAARLDRPAPSS